MGRAINLRELKARYDELGGDRTVAMLGTLMEEKKLKPDDFSIRDLCEAFCGSEFVAALDPRRKSGRRALQEAVSAVDSSAFSNITGQIIFNAVKEGYNFAALIGDQLCTTMPTSFLDGEKIPGIGESGDEAELIGEGKDYPTVGLNEEYVEAPPTEKRGFILPITREAIVADRTGVLIERARQGGKWLGINKEKRVLDVILGQTNNYKRNGTSTNTYLTSGAYINDKSTNALVDWTDIENLELLFDAITDPNTGEPILRGPTNALIVPTALKRTAQRIVQATDVRFGDGASNTTAYYGKNPLSGDNIAIFSSPYVKARTSSATKWFYGDPKSAFRYSEVWGIESVDAPDNNELMFSRDIWMRFKTSERGVAWVYEPRHICRSDQ